MKEINIYTNDVNGALGVLCEKWPHNFEEEQLTFESVAYANQVEVVAMHIAKLPSSEYAYCLHNADEGGELTDYLLPVLRDRDDKDKLNAFLDKIERSLINYYADDFNERLEEIQQRLIEHYEYVQRYGDDERDDAA